MDQETVSHYDRNSSFLTLRFQSTEERNLLLGNRCLGSSLKNADDLIGQLRKNLERENSRGDRKYRLSVSVGVAEHRPESVKSLAELMAIADADMYEKKKARRRQKRSAESELTQRIGAQRLLFAVLSAHPAGFCGRATVGSPPRLAGSDFGTSPDAFT